MNKKVPQMFQTYIWLIDTIRRHQPITLAQINRRWLNNALSEGEEFHRNRFREYCIGIEEMFGVEIACDRGGTASKERYAYRITNEQELRHNPMTRWLLSTMTVAGAVRDSQHLQRRILLEHVPSGDELLLSLTRAMEAGRTVKVQYQKFKDAEPYECELEPYCLKLFRQRWYLLAHRIDRTYLAIYALDRMSEVEETENAFQVPDDFDAELHFAEMYGVFQPTAQEPASRILLRTYRGEWNYLRTLPLHHSQREEAIVRAPDGSIQYVDFSLYVSPTLDLRIELLSRGSSIEVIAPAMLRQQMQDDLRKTLDQYASHA